MSVYKISSLKTTQEEGKGVEDNPFKLSKQENTSSIKVIDFENSYCVFPINFGEMGDEDLNPKNTVLEEVKNGRMDNEETHYMFKNCKALTNFDVDLPNLRIADTMFNGCSNLESFTKSLSALVEGPRMFMDCEKLSTFEVGNLDNLVNGEMFLAWTNVSEFKYRLPKLENAARFVMATPITEFNQELPNVTDASYMFDGTNLHKFDLSLPKVTNADSMFKNCKSLTSFTSDDTSKVIKAQNMFEGCTSLEHLTISLPECTIYSAMCSGCTNLVSFHGTFDKGTGNLSDFLENCPKLEDVYINIPNLNTIDDSTFYNSPNVKRLTMTLTNLYFTRSIDSAARGLHNLEYAEFVVPSACRNSYCGVEYDAPCYSNKQVTEIDSKTIKIVFSAN